MPRIRDMSKQKDKPRDFEKAMERLEEIVREMEGGTLSLEKMMSHFEEGTEMLAFCSRKLNEVERKIEQLVGGQGGGIEAKAFDAQAAENAGVEGKDHGGET